MFDSKNISNVRLDPIFFWILPQIDQRYRNLPAKFVRFLVEYRQYEVHLKKLKQSSKVMKKFILN